MRRNDLGHWNEFDYVVVNDNFDHALEDLQAIVENRGAHLKSQRPEVAQFAAPAARDELAGNPQACYIYNPSNGTLSMARITVEDCLQNEPNLFNLVLLAAKRARRLANGAEATVEWENDKPTVVALREIAAGNITLEMLEEPEEPAAVAPPPAELDMPADFRAPQLGLGD